MNTIINETDHSIEAVIHYDNNPLVISIDTRVAYAATGLVSMRIHGTDSVWVSDTIDDDDMPPSYWLDVAMRSVPYLSGSSMSSYIDTDHNINWVSSQVS